MNKIKLIAVTSYRKKARCKRLLDLQENLNILERVDDVEKKKPYIINLINNVKKGNKINYIKKNWRKKLNSLDRDIV